MELYHYRKPGWRHPCLGVGTAAGLVDIATLDSFRLVERWSQLLTMPDLAERLESDLQRGARVDLPWDALAPAPSLERPHLLPPIDQQEVWGAGVTYQISRLERMRESEVAADIYDRVYSAARPELFFKAAAARVVGPGAAIGVRGDSVWTVPEPELAVICSPSLEVVGFSLGNDVSARDIEGENPLYLPQAKMFAGSCALGPAMRLAAGYDPLAQTLSCRIERDGSTVWADETQTGRLKRGLDELLGYLGRALDFPAGVVLFTGTCLVPPETVALRPGDLVEMTLSGIGTLRNPVAACRPTSLAP